MVALVIEDYPRVIAKSLIKLERYVSRENYVGWDPYDGLLAQRIPEKLRRNTLAGIILIQLNLYSPVNLRPLLGISKGSPNKSLALFARAYLIMYTVFRRDEYLEKAVKLIRILSSNTSKVCSSYHFLYIAPKHYLGPSITDIICVTESLKLYVLAYEQTKNQEYFKLASRMFEILFHRLYVEKGNIAYFKYTLYEQGKMVFNVSGLALEASANFLSLEENIDIRKRYIDKLSKVILFLISHQSENGAWPYSYYSDGNRYYWQIDYHQGLIVDGLNAVLPLIPSRYLRDLVYKSLEKAVNFYMHKQFTPKGVSYYRYPIKYPIDIHNQAQGIITFSKLYRATGREEYLNQAIKIALWTIKNMQGPQGYFYAHHWGIFTNKIPYMRWSQAWMMLALSELLYTLKIKFHLTY